ncbi:MAG: HPP family protein [Planctomycetota bacterium]
MSEPAPDSPSLGFTALHTGISALGLGLLAWVSGEPLLFPAIGASAMLLFTAPAAPISRPRCLLGSHIIGALVGWTWLRLLGLGDAPHPLSAPLDGWHMASGVLSLTSTAWLIRRFDVYHPPAGATTLIVGLGLLPTTRHLGVVAASAVLLALYALLVFRSSKTISAWARLR